MSQMPDFVNIKGQSYKHTVFMVLGKKEDGTPSLLRLIGDEHVVELAGDEEFMTGYVPTHMTRPKKKA